MSQLSNPRTAKGNPLRCPECQRYDHPADTDCARELAAKKVQPTIIVSSGLPALEAGSFAGGETRHAVRQLHSAAVIPFRTADTAPSTKAVNGAGGSFFWRGL